MSEHDVQLADYLRRAGIQHLAVLQAIANTSRAQFVEESLKALAHADEALPIGKGQTISQPYVVARMTELLLGQQKRLGKVLEIGTGSGYQAAILAQLAEAVYTVERIHSLFQKAQQRFIDLDVKNIYCRYADGYQGWLEHAPYAAIMLTAAAPCLPEQLLEQLSDDGGCLVAPIGEAGGWQKIQRVVKSGNKIDVESFDVVTFVPMLPGKG